MNETEPVKQETENDELKPGENPKFFLKFDLVTVFTILAVIWMVVEMHRIATTIQSCPCMRLPFQEYLTNYTNISWFGPP